MKVGDMIEMVTSYRDDQARFGLVLSIERRHGVDCNRHSRVASVLLPTGKLVTWPLDSHYEYKVINEAR